MELKQFLTREILADHMEMNIAVRNLEENPPRNSASKLKDLVFDVRGDAQVISYCDCCAKFKNKEV